VFRAAAELVVAVDAAEQELPVVLPEAEVEVPPRQRLQPIPAECTALPAACVFRDD